MSKKRPNIIVSTSFIYGRAIQFCDFDLKTHSDKKETVKYLKKRRKVLVKSLKEADKWVRM